MPRCLFNTFKISSQALARNLQKLLEESRLNHGLQLNNLEIFMFLNRNCPNDAKIECKSPSNLVELIKTEIELEKV